MMDNAKRYQIWYERRSIQRLYNSFESYQEAYDLMLHLVKQYPRSWRFYIIESETYREMPFKEEA